MHALTIRPTRHRTAAALFALAGAMRLGSHCLTRVARRLHAWLERRRIAALAYRDFATMGERELRDIGLSTVEIHRAAWGASIRDTYPDTYPN